MGPDGGAVDPHERRRLADFAESGENLLPEIAVMIQGLLTSLNHGLAINSIGCRT